MNSEAQLSLLEGIANQSLALAAPNAFLEARIMRRRHFVTDPSVRWEFQSALSNVIKSKGDTQRSLLRAISRVNKNDISLLQFWLAGGSVPQKARSFRLLAKIERHYGLEEGYFKKLISKPSARHDFLKSINSFDKQLVSWHLPQDFDRRTEVQQRDIIAWLRDSILKGSTDYGKFLGRINKHRYSVLFPNILKARTYRRKIKRNQNALVGRNIIAPTSLNNEMVNLVHCQTASLAPIHYRRYSIWKAATMKSHVRIFGQFFGALAAPAIDPIRGLNVPPLSLTFGLVVFPSVVDWFIRWRHARRGFLSVSERNLLYSVAALTREEVGWIRQTPSLALSLVPVPGLVTERDINTARQDWDAACDKALTFAQSRSKEFCRIVRQHRDPFEAILPVLQAKSPLLEYKKIVDEIERHLHEPASSIVEYATRVRAYLLMRIALHLGVRQRNLRELLFCRKGDKHRATKKLEVLQRGELRWDAASRCWEVFIPASAFKNSRSSFFKGRPFHLVLPNIGILYAVLEHYIDYWRPVLVQGRSDPSTFFVRTAVRTGVSAEYDVTGIYDEWKWIIQKYGIYNPYTKRGAIKGLLPHGPHSVRDILATHILRQTGSYELAGFAIQDTPASVMEHYARFLPAEKSAHAAKVLNEVWRSSGNKTLTRQIGWKPIRAIP